MNANSTRTVSTTKTVKVTVSLSEEIVEALRQMADDENTSVTEQIRRAVSMQKWLHEVRRERGTRILLEDAQGKTREVMFVR